MPTGTADSSTSVSLIQRARHFDAEAWQRLCAIYCPLVYRWARVAGLQPRGVPAAGRFWCVGA